ncbi:MAG: dicarboxylate/amino acid:cation symporter [Candidatus Omnitrophica bacterium]|nr:dicarboxylate/amino acid:cation symporter [bacterium]MCL4733610.1 dicarboxylate/amino acid:cation symporter [Candidatus Omnitrophota bacterium]
MSASHKAIGACVDQRGNNRLLFGIFFGLIAGILFGTFWMGHRASLIEHEILLDSPALMGTELDQAVFEQASRGHDYRMVKLLGDLFINALRMLVVPLVFFSMATGIAHLGDVRHIGRTGRNTILFFFLSTSVAVLLGLLFVNLVEPGLGSDISQADSPLSGKIRDRHLSVYDVVSGLVPSNIIKAMAEMDILPVILFSLAFGGILTTLGEKGQLVLQVADGCNQAILKMVQFVVSLAPVGIFGLVGTKVGEEIIRGDIGEELEKLGKYILSVELGLLVHGFIILPLIFFGITRRNPFQFIRESMEALLTAFSTASSSATLPVTLKCVEFNSGLSPRYAGFVLPLGATINMNGTALYEAVAAMYVAQATGVDLGLYHQFLIFLTATLAAIGAPGIPEAGLVTMVVVFEAVGLDPIHIGALLSVDWFLDRCRTTINVWGDMVGTAVIQTLDRGSNGNHEIS